jgi:hypothetical protein
LFFGFFGEEFEVIDDGSQTMYELRGRDLCFAAELVVLVAVKEELDRVVFAEEEGLLS